MHKRELKAFGLLVPNDVFLYDSVAYQKQDHHSAFSPILQASRVFSLHTVVTHVGFGVWPSEQPDSPKSS